MFTKPERDAIYATQKEFNLCKAKFTKGKFHLDHIVALANSGNNDLKNIQVLCIPCHLQKNKHEKEEEYVNMVPTESLFNSTLKEIFNSQLCGSYAFIERLVEQIPKKIKAEKMYHIDIHKCVKIKCIMPNTNIQCFL